MTEYQRLFLVQARTDFAVFELLRRQADLPACHKLHYLQMATELLGKAHAWKHGPALIRTERSWASSEVSPATGKHKSNWALKDWNENWEAHDPKKAYHWPKALRTWRLRTGSRWSRPEYPLAA